MCHSTDGYGNGYLSVASYSSERVNIVILEYICITEKQGTVWRATKSAADAQ